MADNSTKVIAYEDAACDLDRIVKTFSLILSDLEQEIGQADDKGSKLHIYSRIEKWYMSAFDLLFINLFDLQERMAQSQKGASV